MTEGEIYAGVTRLLQVRAGPIVCQILIYHTPPDISDGLDKGFTALSDIPVGENGVPIHRAGLATASLIIQPRYAFDGTHAMLHQEFEQLEVVFVRFGRGDKGTSALSSKVLQMG